jgi:hypothetical protein
MGPDIISFGRSRIGDYEPREFVDCLKRAFTGPHAADFIVLDSSPRGQKFLAACAAFAIDKGWLYCDRIDTGEQEEIASFRLTTAGIALFREPRSALLAPSVPGVKP